MQNLGGEPVYMLMRVGILFGEVIVVAVGVMVVAAVGLMSFCEKVLCELRRIRWSV